MRLLFSVAIGTFGASLFWTGFPIYFASVSEQKWSLSGIYSLAVLGTLAFTLIGGIWGDRGDYKKLAVRSHMVSMLFILLILFFIKLSLTNFLLFVLPFLYFNFSLGCISESVWLLKSSERGELKNRLIERTMVTIVAKLLGFSLGPWLFHLLGSKSLYICLVVFLVTCILQYIIILEDPHVVANDKVMAKISLPAFRSPSFVITAFLTGMLSIPLNPLFVEHISRSGSMSHISYFWFFAGLSGFAATMVMRKTKILENRNWFTFLTVLMCCILFSIFSDGGPVVIIGLSSLYVFSSVYFSAKTQVLATQLANRDSLGSSFGLVSFLIDFGVFVGMLMGSKANSIGGMWLPFILSFFVILRCISLSRYQKVVAL